MNRINLIYVFAVLSTACSTSSDHNGKGGTGGPSTAGSSGSGGAGQGGVSGGTTGTGGHTSSSDALGGQSTGGSSGKGGSSSDSVSVVGGSGLGGQAGGSSMSGGSMSGRSTGAGGSAGLGGSRSGGSSQATGGSVGGQSGSGAGSGSGESTGASGGQSASGGSKSGSGAGSAAGAGGGSGGASSTGGNTGTGTSHWVGTWTASPYVDAQNPPPASLSNSVLRQIAHVSLGGSQIRVQFSNLSGNGPVTITSAHIALCKASPAVDSTIDPATDKALAFSGTGSVTIAQGKEVWSDPIDFTVAPLGNISITTAFGSVPSSVCGHSGSRTTSYLQTNSTVVNASSMTSAQKTDHWFIISGIDVMADAAAKAIVAIGDSITDGRGTDTNKNNRWTDILAARLRANAATSNVAIMNQGIGATNLIGTSGTAAQARFSRDVLGQSGVKYAIVYDGVNDIAGDASFVSMKAAYDQLISAAHAKGLLIYGATITPFGGDASFYTAAHESVRQQVNTYIKSGAFDGYVDFDAALTDGGNPPKLLSSYATWSQSDGLHPGPAT